MNPLIGTNHSSTDMVREDAGSPPPSAHLVCSINGNINVEGNLRMDLAATAGSGFERFRDKNIGEKSSQLHSRYKYRANNKYLANIRDTEYNKIRAWLFMKSKPIAFVHGGAGVGKSIFARHLVFRLGESNNLATHGFFERNFSPTMNLNNVIDHMAYELGCRHPDIIRFLTAANPPSDDLSLRLSTLIVAPLRMLPGDEPKVVLFDAVDECSRPQDLLQAIYEISHEIPSNVKFLVTSRSGGEIENFIEKIQDSVYNLNISLVELSTMKSFFRRRLEVVRDLHKYIDHLINRADGSLFWADTVCTFVTSPNNGDPSKLLEKILFSQDFSYSPERPLDNLHSAALNHLFPVLERDKALNEARPARTNFTTIFAVMYVAFDPLNKQALEELVGEAPEGIISNLRSLQIHLPNDGRIAPAADLFPASFLDFIVSKDRCPDADFRIEPVEAHKKVATRCIQLLLKTFKDNGVMPYAELSIAVRYAIRNWASHAAECISRLDSRDIPLEWKAFLETHGYRWGKLLLSLIAGPIPVGSNSKGDDLLLWLNAQFLQLYRKKPLGGHLRKILHVNQVVENFSRGRKVWVQRRLALLLGNVPRYIIPENWNQAISIWPRGNLDPLASSFSNLAGLFYSTFLSKRSIDDLDQAIFLIRAARSLQPAWRIILDNLAIYLLSRFHETGRYQDLKDLVDLYQVTIKIPRRPRRPLVLARSINVFPSFLRSSCERTGSKEDLEKTIELNEEAPCSLSSSPDRPNLPLCFGSRFNNDMSLEILEKAICLHEKALGEREGPHSDHPWRLIVLAHFLRLRGIHIGSQEDLDRAISLSQEALDLYSDRTNDNPSTARTGDLPEFHSQEERIPAEFEAFPLEDSAESLLEQSYCLDTDAT